MGIDDIPGIFSNLEASIRKLQSLRNSSKNIEERKELDGSIMRLQQEYNTLQRKYNTATK